MVFKSGDRSRRSAGQVVSEIWLHRFAVLVSACTLVLIFVGGLVTSTGSGLAVPDWPLSYGGLFPEMVGGVKYEHGHRVVAAAVGLLTLILAFWLWRREHRRWVRLLGGLAVITVICQGVLGGITVLLRLPTAVSVSHAALAQIFFCITVCLAVFTSRTWQEMKPHVEDRCRPSLRLLTLTATAVIYVQILLGALMRHTGSGLAIPDFPLAYGRLVPPFFTRQILIHFLHRLGAVVVVIIVFWLAVRILRQHRRQKALRNALLALLSSLAVQIFLGAEVIWSSREEIVTTMHVAGGALTLAASLFLALLAHRLMPARNAAILGHSALARVPSEQCQ